MANKVVKGLTVKIGGDTTELGKAIEKVEKKSADLSSELGQINRLLKFDPKNTELLAQKQKVLTDAVETTKEKLETLKEAERQVQEQFERGEVSEAQVRALQREIIETTNKLGRYEKAVEETNKALENTADSAHDAANGIDDTADSADKAEGKTDELGDTLNDTLSSGFTAVAAAAAAALAALVACSEATAEYRREMGKLNTAFTANGHSSEAATETYKELQSILGETDQAVEAANHLALLAKNEDELRTLTHALTGVYATFGASLPLEGLAEAANESAKVGAVVGPMADAINWANASTEDWNAALGTNKKAMAAFNKALKEGEATEDAYSAALAACSDEQERQQLISQTLTKLYGKAADQYKETNKEVIRANKANENWTATMAEIGETITPVITDFKELGTTVAKEANEPIKKLAQYLKTDAIPALTKASTWAVNNLPVIGAGIAGVTAAFLAYKVAVLAATAAQIGIKAAIEATTIAQTALNIVQAASPWGLVAVAVAGVTTALIAYAASTAEAKREAEGLTLEEKELLTQSQETAQSLREQRAAMDETAGGIQAQMGHVQKLADELQNLADKSGKVKESDQARASFILNELNEALGTEYTMTDGVIQKYADLKKNIDAVIEAKTANALLEARNEQYVAALEAEAELLQGLTLAEKDYKAQKEITEEAYANYAAAIKAQQDKMLLDANYFGSEQYKIDEATITGHWLLWEKEQELQDEKYAAYEEALAIYGQNADTIMGYEEAQAEALQGNYDRTVDILKGKVTTYNDYAEGVDEATKQTLDTLYKEAIDAGLAAERTKKNWEDGVEGYTAQMVLEAEKGYEEALAAYADAKLDAEGVGKDIGDGLSEGMESKRQSVIGKIKSLVSGIIAAARKEADSHSPSRKMVAFGEDMGEGAEIGLENKTDDVVKAAREQVSGVLGTYQSELATDGQGVFNSIQRRAAAGQAAAQQSAADAAGSKLDKILAAIERGQILTIDSEKLIGATADKMDDKLGQRRILAARGAL